MSLAEKTEFPFFDFPIFRYPYWFRLRIMDPLPVIQQVLSCTFNRRQHAMIHMFYRCFLVQAPCTLVLGSLFLTVIPPCSWPKHESARNQKSKKLWAVLVQHCSVAWKHNTATHNRGETISAHVWPFSSMAFAVFRKVGIPSLLIRVKLLIRQDSTVAGNV